MKTLVAAAFSALLFGAIITPAFADDQTSTDPTRHTMGDSGKLPATNNMSKQVPEQGAGTGASSGTSGSHTMGDEGKLPATNSMSKQVPEQGAGTQNPK